MLNLFNIIALGQCGCRIAKEFNKIGFDTYYINSDTVDMRDLNVAQDNILMIGDTGSGRSPVKGKMLLEKNFEKFSLFMDNILKSNTLNVFTLGLGGGTGGGIIIPALKYCISKGYKIGVIATLPEKSNILDMDNALRILKELKTLNINMFMLADNEYLVKKIGIKDDNWWEKINYYILTKVAVIFDLLRETKTSQEGVGSIDRGEVSRIIQYGNGLFDIRDLYFRVPNDINLSDEELKLKLAEPALIEGYTYKDSTFYMVNVDVPIVGGYSPFALRVFNTTKSIFGSSLCRTGMFKDPSLQDVLRVSIIAAGLDLPKILRNRINTLKKASQKIEIKKSKETKFDFVEIGSININEDFDL